MRIPAPRRIARRARSGFARDPDRFLADVRGVIHVGANSGQERDLYRRHGLEVAWVEPIPEVFDVLTANVRDVPRQRAFRHLVTNEEDRRYDFHVANNRGASSSILEMKMHPAIWPKVPTSPCGWSRPTSPAVRTPWPRASATTLSARACPSPPRQPRG